MAKDTRPELREGDLGDAVAQVQCLLDTRSGHPGEVGEDGVFDPVTTAGVRWVQQCSGIDPSGVTDEATWKKLYRATKGCGKKTEQSGTGTPESGSEDLTREVPPEEVPPGE